MPKIVILVGPPASGKTTYAKKLQEKGYARVSKDDIRRSVFGVQYDPDLEGAVRGIANAIVTNLVIGEHDIVIDCTNLKERDVEEWKGVVKGACVALYNPPEYQFVVEDSFCDVPREDLLLRDSQREASVGEEVIEKMCELVSLYQERKGMKDGKKP